MKSNSQKYRLSLLAVCAALFGTVISTHATDAKKPSILILWGDDIGWENPSCYHRGMMGYQTPNIDRIAREGALFTDWYGQQSCTAGRSCFITGTIRLPHRHAQGRLARRKGRAPGAGCNHRRIA